MNVLFFTAHPAQVHNFKLLKLDLEARGHKVFWMATEKDISVYLLNIYKIKYSLLEKPGKSFFAKAKALFLNTIKCIAYLRKHKIDIAVSRVSPYLSIACFLLRKPHLALADTESSGVYNKIFAWFVSAILTPKPFQRILRADQLRFIGNIELFYLHPNRFQPDAQILNLLEIQKGNPYVIMRFVSWDAYHDKGLSGFSDANKMKAVEDFSRYARVFISAEKELPPALEPYKIQIPPERMHDALAYACMFFGESATMASESAVLGTPAVYLNENWFGTTSEEERFGLLFSFKSSLSEQQSAIDKGLELLSNQCTHQEMDNNRARFLSDKIDLTAFMVWFIEHYPGSKSQIVDKPEFWGQFR